MEWQKNREEKCPLVAITGTPAGRHNTIKIALPLGYDKMPWTQSTANAETHSSYGIERPLFTSTLFKVLLYI